ncbi:unnamed protein product [Rhizophagus irregularis]|uniref:Uncharacterized protein n=1 Tax=Rhizophagus irregularis TaxID=588596 RepID=A0A915ZXV9_9GLOM|nr:unnamed protein product [Rhizophagus irregularis]CAB4494906.1 unnamed protein product [Rhizophagus irregularis]CAB5194322.1 unnamed protein product [Rhizophagus irregularis]CAB5364259.1 unnamed protein product [Rhizophagus irregularis]CAB5391325.1 unnamed protein product [Rhizophagus irregularis]
MNDPLQSSRHAFDAWPITKIYSDGVKFQSSHGQCIIERDHESAIQASIERSVTIFSQLKMVYPPANFLKCYSLR